MREPCAVFTDLGEQHRSEHGADAGKAGEDQGVRVLRGGCGDCVVVLGELRVQKLQHLGECESGEALPATVPGEPESRFCLIRSARVCAGTLPV